MRNLILAALNKKYLGLSKKVLGLVADKLVTTVTEEAGIQAAVDALDNMPVSLQEFAAFVQKEGDTRVTEALKKKTTPAPGDTDDPELEEETPPASSKGKNTQSKQIAELTGLVQQLLKKDTQSTMQQKLHAKLTEKKIPLYLAKNVVIEKEEDLDGVVGEIEEGFTGIKQELANQGFASTTTPSGGVVTAVKSDVADADIAAWSKGKTAPAATISKT